MFNYFKYLLFISAFCTSTLVAQEKEIKNTQTSKHLKIPQTNVLMIPPDGFSVTPNFLGFKKDDGNQILMMGGMNYYTDVSGLSKSRFEKEGAKVFEESNYKINGYHAKFICVQDDSLHKNNLLAFGDSTISLLFFAKYSTKDPKLEKQVKASLLSIIFEKK